MRATVPLAVLLLAALAASGDDLRPRIIVSSETRDAGEVSSSRLMQYIELFLERDLTESIKLQFEVEAKHDELSTERIDPPRGMNADSSGYEIRPAGTLIAEIGRVSTETAWSMRSSRFEVSEATTSRDDEQFLSRAAWGSARFLPGGSVRAWRSRLDDPLSGRELVNDLVEGSLDYRWGGLAVAAGQSYRIDRDSRAGYERTTIDNAGDLTFNDTFAGGKLSISALANGTMTTISDETSGVASIPTYVLPSRAFWGIDDTPLDATDRPLSAYPTLIDGRIAVSTGIDLGPESASFQAIAFDIGRSSQVDEIQIVVRDEKLGPVTSPAGIVWDVYTSIDGERWTPHNEELVVEFDTARSLYEISFRQVDVRWIKVVTFGVASQPVFVTEAFILFHTVRNNDAGDSEFTTLSSTAALTFTPVRSVTLGYNGATYQSMQKSGESLQSNIDDLTHNVFIRFDPGKSLGYELRYELHDVDNDRSFQSSRYLTGSMRYMPRPQLSGTLTCTRREETTDLATLEGRSCTASASALIFPTLDLTAGATERRQQLDTGGSQTSRSVYASSTARLSPSLRMTLSAAMNRSELEDWTGALTPPRDDRITSDVVWFGGRALELGATIGWIDSSLYTGLVQRYRVRWSPFADGSVSLTTNYVHDIDPYTNNRSQRLLVSPRWQINPHTALNVTWVSVSNSGESRYDSDSLVAALVVGR